MSVPIPMILHCPRCGLQHVDAPEPEKGWDNPPHKSHMCHGCGCIWRPADAATAGVEHIETIGLDDNWATGRWTLRDRALAAFRKCMSAWACGEPPHRVEEMIRAVGQLGYALDPNRYNGYPRPPEQSEARGGANG